MANGNNPVLICPKHKIPLLPFAGCPMCQLGIPGPEETIKQFTGIDAFLPQSVMMQQTKKE